MARKKKEKTVSGVCLMIPHCGKTRTSERRAGKGLCWEAHGTYGQGSAYSGRGRGGGNSKAMQIKEGGAHVQNMTIVNSQGRKGETFGTNALSCIFNAKLFMCCIGGGVRVSGEAKSEQQSAR